MDIPKERLEALIYNLLDLYWIDTGCDEYTEARLMKETGMTPEELDYLRGGQD